MCILDRYETDAKVEIDWVDTETLTEQNVAKRLAGVDGILIPGGFGGRGVEGKVVACKYARKKNIPYLGICLGMQVAVIEFARNVLGYEDANSSEIVPEGKHSVIDLMPDQYGVKMGGTMRLGAYPCKVLGERMKEAYGAECVSERHRHRFEFNNDYREEIEAKGMKIAGVSPDGTLVEAVEIPENDFFLGVQFHPEFKSRPNNAHPIFREFIRHAVKYKETRKK
ncbi:MAG: gamma-glutamyl-gamma-aminobutyrate hydrolase family protein [Clostridia bacterium]|nr:gamma-glutamyl-gamma-aminobutyrate hydrolase family protein [Clostridia bacterium]